MEKVEKAFIFNGAILIDSALSGFALLADSIGKKQEMLEHEAEYYKIRVKKPWEVKNSLLCSKVADKRS